MPLFPAVVNLAETRVAPLPLSRQRSCVRSPAQLAFVRRPPVSPAAVAAAFRASIRSCWTAAVRRSPRDCACSSRECARSSCECHRSDESASRVNRSTCGRRFPCKTRANAVGIPKLSRGDWAAQRGDACGHGRGEGRALACGQDSNTGARPDLARRADKCRLTRLLCSGAAQDLHEAETAPAAGRRLRRWHCVTPLFEARTARRRNGQRRGAEDVTNR